MSGVDEWFAEHQVHSTITQLENAIGSARERDEAVQVAGELGGLERVALRAESVMESVDPELVPASSLDQLQNQLSGLHQKVNTFARRGDVSQIAATTGEREQALRLLSQLAVAYVPPTTDSLSEATSTFRRSAGQHVAQIRSEAEQLQSALNDLKNTITELKQSVDQQSTDVASALRDFQTQFSDAEAKRSERFESATTTRQQSFEQSLENQKSEVQTALAKAVEDAGTALSTFQQESREKLSDFEEQAISGLAKLHQLEEEAKRAVSSTGEVVLTGGHSGTAAKERRIAATLRWIALILFAAAAVVAVWTLIVLPRTAEAVRWEEVLARVVGVAALAVPALYAAREARYHGERERVNRKLALELAAIDPYLAHFSPEERIKIKTDLKDRFFGVRDESAGNDETISAGGMYKLLERVLDRITAR